MNGTERVVSIITVCLLGAFIAMLLVVSSCSLQEAKIKAPDNVLRTKSAHILKSQCIGLHGDWDNNYNSCTFTKAK